jgi:ABC-type phosphate transport system substrate-binding protein
MKKSLFSLLAAATAALSLAGCGQGPTGGGAGDSAARQEIRIVGSSTVYPFSQAVAEHFAQANPTFRAGSRRANSSNARPTASARSSKCRSASTASR